jgi:hypothetical protein
MILFFFFFFFFFTPSPKKKGGFQTMGNLNSKKEPPRKNKNKGAFYLSLDLYIQISYIMHAILDR